MYIKLNKAEINEIKKNIKSNIIIKTFNENNVYYLHNSYHLGDNVFNFILFYIIKPFIEENNIKIYFFNKVLQKLNLNVSISKLYYSDKNLINRYNKLNDKYKNIDILVINSQPLSGQYNYNKHEWDNYITKLYSLYKVITTTKVNNFLCTTDDNLYIKDIAAISTHVKVVIAINSGVLPSLLNIKTLTNVKKFFVFDNRCYYSYPNFEIVNNIDSISINDLINDLK